MKNSTSTHNQVIKRVIRYLVDIVELSKRFESFESHDEELVNYIDFSYDDDEKTRRSHSSYVFLLYNDVISHSFKRQDTIFTSSIEAKYVDQRNASKNAYFLSQVLKELDEKVESMKIRANNQSIIALINNSNNHRRIKYISIQYHYVKELMKIERIKFNYVLTTKMLANDLIKSLRSQLFIKFIRMLELMLSSLEYI